uniref:SAM domain-containing protein n=1 Tax=Periophthalmus magnuspinnatus TaxID=409849 RepID=A0A3B3ZW45_9GOBI
VPPASTQTPAGCAYMLAESQEIYLRMDHQRRRSGYRLGRIIARQQLLRRIAGEIEAKEACDWLRAAGFPQYAQLFEDSQFPIDIRPVKKDHDFLDKDLVEPLCRRLNTLNKCASMKLDVNLPKKKVSEVHLALRSNQTHCSYEVNLYSIILY